MAKSVLFKSPGFGYVFCHSEKLALWRKYDSDQYFRSKFNGISAVYPSVDISVLISSIFDRTSIFIILFDLWRKEDLCMSKGIPKLNRNLPNSIKKKNLKSK